MKKSFLLISLFIGSLTYGHALIINEIMSNPTGDDGGREWIEVYNNSSSTVDISSLTMSIKGGSFVSVFPVSGGTTIVPDGYAIIGSTVSGATKFLQDYASYSGPLLRSSISLVNTGVTSVEIKIGGATADVLSSYTAAKEGQTYSRFTGSFSAGTPTPGSENKTITEEVSNTPINTSSTTATQATIAQAPIPVSDIILYLPQEKIVVAGAESNFSIFGLTRAGNAIENLVYTWAYGDGGQGVGSSTLYRYAYPGRYIAQVEGGNGHVAGTGRMNVRVVAPDISITGINTGKYGAYIDIENPNNYDLDFSQWRLLIDGASFPFPKNTLIAADGITHISGLAMGFASTTILNTSVVKIVFPNLEEVARYVLLKENLQSSAVVATLATGTKPIVATTTPLPAKSVGVYTMSKPKGLTANNPASISRNNESSIKSISLSKNESKKDTRIIAFFKSIFSK